METLSLHNLKPAKGSKRQPKRVGRGNASGKGTTAGRGGKGQTARSGGRNKLKLLGMRHIILQTPKLRGFQSLRPKATVLSLGDLASAFHDGGQVTPSALAKKGLIASVASRVKIVSGGKVRKLTVSGLPVSVSAKTQIESVGGTVK